jgi:hypothetical protein
MSRPLLLALAVLMLVPASAPARNGVTPVSPKAGDTVPVGERPVFKVDVRGRHTGVFVHVCAKRRKDGDGVLCSRATAGRARHVRGDRYELRARFFDYPRFWLNTPGTYFWQAYRTACVENLRDCRAEGRIVKFRVG